MIWPGEIYGLDLGSATNLLFGGPRWSQSTS